MLTTNSILHGREEPARAVLSLRAGPLTMTFEPQSAFLRRIFLGGHEVLRGIYVAVRDRHWGTVPVQIEGLKHEVKGDSFELSFAADCRARAIHFRWNGRVSGTPEGTLRYAFEGEAVTTFFKNRIGFCVLHPLRECCGARARFECADEQCGQVRFPMLIEPQIVGRSTFSNLRLLAHEVQPGCWAELEFEGDVFETEDQRNWTDTSFKTYCTPLALPFPAEIQAGTRTRQVITLRLKQPKDSKSARVESSRVSAEAILADEDSSGTTLIIPRAPVSPMPRLGLGIASHGKPLNPRETSSLSLLQLSHLRVDLRMADPDWPQALSRIITEAQQLGVALELAVHLGPDSNRSALEECGSVLKRTRVPVARVLAFRQSEPATRLETLRLARRYLGLSELVIGGGSDTHFCEINREQALGRFGLSEADCISWPITPQVHAFDDRSVMENLEAQPHTVAAARSFAGNKPLSISPITLRPRFNAVATGEEHLDPDQLPPQVDPRQLSMFNAAWTLGSITGLAPTNVESLTYFETTGWRGLIETCPASSGHPLFPSGPGMVFPVCHLFTALAGFSQMAAVPQESCRDSIAALCLFDAQARRRVLCANLTGKRLPLVLDLGGEHAWLSTLDLTNWDSNSDMAGPAWSPRRNVFALLACSRWLLALTQSFRWTHKKSISTVGQGPIRALECSETSGSSESP